MRDSTIEQDATLAGFEVTPEVTSSSAPPRRSRDELEKQARAAVDLRAGRSLTDMEWARARASLIDLITLLRGWHEGAESKGGSASLPKAA